MRLVDLCPYGVYPPRSGGHRLVHHTSAGLGARHDVFVFSSGLRRADGLHLRSFVQQPEGRYTEYRHVTPLTFTSYLRRRRTGLPPLRASDELRWTAPGVLRRALADADVVQVEQPWQFRFARAAASCPVVLVTQNAEAQLLAARGFSPRVVELAARVERDALARADAVVFLSAEDRNALAGAYGLRRDAFVTCGVGVDTTTFRPPADDERGAAKAALGIEGPLALFAGSWHLPNRSAVETLRQIAASTPGWSFLVVGSVGTPAETSARVRVTGPVDDVLPYFRAADVAVNPMQEGSGVNLKVLEYLAAGLPTVSTPFGIRGLDVEDVVTLAEPAGFPAALAALAAPDERARRGGAARRVAESRLGWEPIVRMRERILEAALGSPRRARGG